MYKYRFEKLEWNYNKLGLFIKFNFFLFFNCLFKILGFGKNVYKCFSYKDFKWIIKNSYINLYVYCFLCEIKEIYCKDRNMVIKLKYYKWNLFFVC